MKYEPNTALWHAYELGRIAFQEGDTYRTPFDNTIFLRSSTTAWKEGWDFEHDAHSQVDPAARAVTNAETIAEPT